MITIQAIYLIGFMGSGKSTIGQYLAKALNKTFVDTDQYIESKYGRITEIFREFGEETFRAYEVKALKETRTYEVISTGGGIVEKNENYETMKKHGIIFYLHTSFQEINNRLGKDQSRPLWGQALEENKKLYDRRIPKYKKFCDYTIVTDGKTIDEVALEIISIIDV